MTGCVVVFAYYFPPSAGPGVRRSVRLVRDVREQGFEPTVVTVRGETFRNREEFGVDEGGLRDVPEDVAVERVNAWSLPRLRWFLMRAKLMRLLLTTLYPIFWERQALWPIPAIRRGLRLIRERRPGVIYTSTGPFCSNLIGLVLNRLTGVPWVTDYRDLWTGSWLKWWPTRLHFELERALERTCLGRATRVIANTPTARETLGREFPELDLEKVDVIPNGWDDPPAPPADLPDAPADRIVLLHTGSFDAPREDGGRIGRLRDWIEHRRAEYDLSTHGPAVLFEALAQLEADAPELARRLVLQLVGRVDPIWTERARRLGLDGRVEFLGPRSFAETRWRQGTADLLVLTTVSRRDRGPVPRVNAKVYEYMRAGRPILVLSDPGDAARFAVESGLGRVVSPRDPAGVRGVLEELARDPEGYRARYEARPDVVESFGSRALGRRFAETFRRAAARGEHGEGRT